MMDLAVPQYNVPLLRGIEEAKQQAGRRVRDQLLDLVRHASWRAKFTADDYYKYRLFDKTVWPAEEVVKFLGRAQQIRAIKAINFKQSWFGVIEDKQAAGILLAGSGLPMPKLKGWWHPSRPMADELWLRSTDEFKKRLRSTDLYPAFMKPALSSLSLGAAMIEAYDPATDQLRSSTGENFSVDEFVQACERFTSGGYLIQERLPVHPDLREFSGNAISTVRILTVREGANIRVFKVAMKLARDGNVCDNFWRSGNILASIDSQNGQIKRAITGNGSDQQEVTSDSPAGRFLGWTIPDWTATKALACKAMQALPTMRLVGWDIAVTANGPVILEANTLPDLNLIQLAERQGFDTPEFQALVAMCVREKQDEEQSAKQNKTARRKAHVQNTLERARKTA